MEPNEHPGIMNDICKMGEDIFRAFQMKNKRVLEVQGGIFPNHKPIEFPIHNHIEFRIYLESELSFEYGPHAVGVFPIDFT